MVKFLFILASIFMFFRYIVPLILKSVVKSFVKSHTPDQEDKEVKWGNMKVKYKNKEKTNQRNNDNGGEYVDFEEIK